MKTTVIQQSRTFATGIELINILWSCPVTVHRVRRDGHECLNGILHFSVHFSFLHDNEYPQYDFFTSLLRTELLLGDSRWTCQEEYDAPPDGSHCLPVWKTNMWSIGFGHNAFYIYSKRNDTTWEAFQEIYLTFLCVSLVFKIMILCGAQED